MTRDVGVCIWYISCFMFSELPGIGLCLSLILESSQPLLLQKYFLWSILSLFFPCIPIMHVTSFDVVPQFLDVCSPCSILFISNLVWEISIDLSSCSLITYSAMLSLLMNLLKTFFISITLLLFFLKFPFDYFLESPYLLHYSSIFLTFFTFSIRALNVFIIVILNSLIIPKWVSY